MAQELTPGSGTIGALIPGIERGKRTVGADLEPKPEPYLLSKLH